MEDTSQTLQNRKRKRIGIMGGTFDPIHNGHLMIAKQALREFVLDLVIFVPTGRSPHKNYLYVTSPKQRCEMTQLAIEDQPDFDISLIEQEHNGTSYTYRTLELLQEQYPNARLYFIMGADSLRDFHEWREPQRILQTATVLASVRDNVNSDEMLSLIRKLSKQFGGEIYLLHCDKYDISSREIRKYVGEGRQVDPYLPQKVSEYIRKQGLYQMGCKMDIDEIKHQLKEKMKKNRYEHTLGVMETSVALAQIYGCDETKARYAGLLHDCAKHMDDQEKIDLCEKYEVMINPSEYANPTLLHAKAGAILAKEIYQVNDPEILHAIEVHTTGTVNMNLLDKIVFCADYIEPNRDRAPHLKELRKLSKKDLDETIYLILRDTVDYLSRTDACKDPETMHAYDFYRELHENSHNKEKK